MSILLDQISFNHDPNSIHTDAINLRRNATAFVPVPEWQRGVSVRPEDSVAAYAIEETRGNTLTIRVKLVRTDRSLNGVEVRAIPASDTALPFVWPVWPYPVWGNYPYAYWNYQSYWNYYTLLYLSQLGYSTTAAASRHTSVLGSVKARQVTFRPNDESVEVLFELENAQLWQHGIGSREVAWQWQYRIDAGMPWRNLAYTRHKIYTVLAMPTDPWLQQPYHPSNTQLPWLEVLEFAADWAFGAATRDTAAERVTRAVYNLGTSHLRYGCEAGGLAQYSDLFYPYFYCTEFLERLRNGPGRGWLVNCSDCAAIVSTFANVLGCDLWQSRMGTGVLTFVLNPVRTIGSNLWQQPCGLPGFAMHEVAWKGGCTVDDEIFDACLEVDGGGDPTAPPHTPLLPVNMIFGRSGDGLYRDRLAAPHSNAREICEARPESQQRRLVV